MFNQDSILVNMLVKNVFIPEKKLLNKSSPGLNKTWPLTQRGESKHRSKQIQLNCSLETKVKVCPLE